MTYSHTHMHVPSSNDDDEVSLGIELMTTWMVINSFSIIRCCHQWRRGVIRENFFPQSICMCVCVPILAIDDNLCLPIILIENSVKWTRRECISLSHSLTLMCTRVHTQMISSSSSFLFFPYLKCLFYGMMIDKHIVTAVSLRFRFQTRHAPFFILSLSMTLKLNPLGDVILFLSRSLSLSLRRKTRGNDVNENIRSILLTVDR